MAEWKTDTEEVKKIVKACRDFKGSLQEEKCDQFIKNLDKYAREILTERKKIELQLEGAIRELEKAKSDERGARAVLRGLQVASFVSFIWPPARVAAMAAIAAAELVVKYMKESTEKCERNVELLEQALEIYLAQAKASAELVAVAWESLKKALHFYTDKHKEFIKRLNQASDAIDNEYNIEPPEILKERDFESPTIVYKPKTSAFDERLKDLREDFSFSLYTDLKNRFHHDSSGESDRAKEHGKDLMSGSYSFDESLNLAKKHCVKNFKEALQDFTEKIKKSPNDLSAMNEAFADLDTELERSFSVIVPLESLEKPACAHHALKALETALKNRDLGFDAAELEQIAKGFIPKGYLWHFDANVLGNLALVREELLLSVKHTKGYPLWKTFLQKQN